MSFETWVAFAVGSFLICLTPGPNMLRVLSSSVEYGFRNSIYTMAGCLSAVSLMIMISVAGTGTLLAASPELFLTLRYLGAAYLIYIGLKSILSTHGSININSDENPVRISPKHIFKKGFYVGISNPKAIIFAFAFFSQFIDVSKPYFHQLAILFITFVILECSCYLIYALSGKALARLLKQQKTLRIFNAIIGLIFIYFGLYLILRS